MKNAHCSPLLQDKFDQGQKSVSYQIKETTDLKNQRSKKEHLTHLYVTWVMPGGLSCCEQVGELTVGFQAVHCLEVEQLDNGKVLSDSCLSAGIIVIFRSQLSSLYKGYTINQEPEWVCGEGSSLREEPGSLTLSPVPDKKITPGDSWLL